MDEKTVNDIKSVFRQYDSNGDGTISKDELERVIKALSGPMVAFAQADVDRIFAAIDVNQDKKIQYDEFINWLTDGSPFDLVHQAVSADVRERSCISSAAIDFELDFDGDESDLAQIFEGLKMLGTKGLRKLFTEADIDKNGCLQLAELKQVVFPDGNVDSIALSKIFAQMDKNSDGKVRCGEFVSYVIEAKRRLDTVATASDKQQIVGAFSQADSDNDGCISLVELEKLLGVETEDERRLVEKCFTGCDKNSDGGLCMLEFARLYGKELVKEAGVEVEWKDVVDEESSEDE